MRSDLDGSLPISATLISSDSCPIKFMNERLVLESALRIGHRAASMLLITISMSSDMDGSSLSPVSINVLRKQRHMGSESGGSGTC